MSTNEAMKLTKGVNSSNKLLQNFNHQLKSIHPDSWSPDWGSIRQVAYSWQQKF
jgi:hypothetical protein